MEWLLKRFVKDYKEIKTPSVRSAYGRLLSTVGIILNIFLFAIKFFVGLMIGSVAMQADGINNLSDAGSSIVSFVGFKLASRPADKEHPFGHERYECIASMVVAVIVLLLGVELARNGIEKILNPELVSITVYSVMALVISILVKIYMYLYNTKYGKKLDSSVMKATAADSFGDVLATSAVLISLLIGYFFSIPVDGYIGVVVAAIIFYSGIQIIREALDEILGKAPSSELVEKLETIMKGYDDVLGFHDLMVHDYGPNRLYGSAHVEVDSKRDILESHDMIDNIEKDIYEQLHMAMVIHMDPIVIDDPVVNGLRKDMKEILLQIDSDLSMHDFRVVFGKTHTNIIFDVVIPYECKVRKEDIQYRLQKEINKVHKNHRYYVVVNFDRPYVDIEL